MKTHPALQHRGFSRTQTRGALTPIRRIIHPDRVANATFLVITVAVQHLLPHGLHFLARSPGFRGLQRRIDTFHYRLSQIGHLGRRAAEIQRTGQGRLVMVTGAAELHHDEALIRQRML